MVMLQAIRQTDSIPQILLDPTSEEMTRDIHGLIALASIPAMGTTTNLTIEGELSLPLAKEVSRPVCALVDAYLIIS